MLPPNVMSLAALAVLTLSACGNQPVRAERDAEPALERALAAPLMVDLELVSRDNASAAIAGGGPGAVDIPTYERGSEAIAAARAEAEKLAGGKLAAATAPADGSNAVLRDAATAAQRASAVKGPGNNCGATTTYAMDWSLRLPAALAIYPRGHLLEAAGSDANGCRLRIVRFVTPVEPADIIAFYESRARAARLEARHVAADGLHVLSGGNGKIAFAIQARQRGDGMTETDLVVNGG